MAKHHFILRQIMKHKLAFLLLLIATTTVGHAQNKPKKHPGLPEAFENAHTVFVETREGDITDITLDPQDRTAILDIQDGIQDWGRYSLSRSRIDADLIILIRKGRLQRDRPNSRFPASSPNSTHPPIQDPADASQGSESNRSNDGFTQEKDELQVYTLQSNGKLKGPIWHSEEVRGLDSPNLLLLQRLKIEVEKAYPKPSPNQQPAP
jgi:hypothetical protein